MNYFKRILLFILYYFILFINLFRQYRMYCILITQNTYIIISYQHGSMNLFAWTFNTIQVFIRAVLPPFDYLTFVHHLYEASTVSVELPWLCVVIMKKSIKSSSCKIHFPTHGELLLWLWFLAKLHSLGKHVALIMESITSIVNKLIINSIENNQTRDVYLVHRVKWD